MDEKNEESSVFVTTIDQPISDILIVVSDGFGGYGDFLFALKLGDELRKQYVVLPRVYIITQPTGKEKIKRLEGDVEFNTVVLTPDELEAVVSRKEITNAVMFEGPVFQSDLFDSVQNALKKIEVSIPFFMVAEYNSAVQEHDVRVVYRKKSSTSQLNYAGFIKSGIYANNLPTGLLLSDVLINPPNLDALISMIDDKIIEPLLITLRGSGTQLSMQYSHDKYHDKASLKLPPAVHYLQVHREFYQDSNEHQDVIMVGADRDSKRIALKIVLDKLIQDNFSKISFYDAEAGVEEIVYKDDTKPEKKYRVIYTKGMSHPSMIACTALSGPLFGATGDQSFGEAVCANKIIIYECLEHKKELLNNYNDVMRQFIEKYGETSYLSDLNDELVIESQYEALGKGIRRTQQYIIDSSAALLEQGNLVNIVVQDTMNWSLQVRRRILNWLQLNAPEKALDVLLHYHDKVSFRDECDGKSLIDYALKIDEGSSFVQYYYDLQEIYSNLDSGKLNECLDFIQNNPNRIRLSTQIESYLSSSEKNVSSISPQHKEFISALSKIRDSASKEIFQLLLTGQRTEATQRIRQIGTHFKQHQIEAFISYEKEINPDSLFIAACYELQASTLLCLGFQEAALDMIKQHQEQVDIVHLCSPSELGYLHTHEKDGVFSLYLFKLIDIGYCLLEKKVSKDYVSMMEFIKPIGSNPIINGKTLIQMAIELSLRSLVSFIIDQSNTPKSQKKLYSDLLSRIPKQKETYIERVKQLWPPEQYAFTKALVLEIYFYSNEAQMADNETYRSIVSLKKAVEEDLIVDPLLQDNALIGLLLIAMQRALKSKKFTKEEQPPIAYHQILSDLGVDIKNERSLQQYYAAISNILSFLDIEKLENQRAFYELYFIPGMERLLQQRRYSEFTDFVIKNNIPLATVISQRTILQHMFDADQLNEVKKLINLSDEAYWETMALELNQRVSTIPLNETKGGHAVEKRNVDLLLEADPTFRYYITHKSFVLALIGELFPTGIQNAELYNVLKTYILSVGTQGLMPSTLINFMENCKTLLKQQGKESSREFTILERYISKLPPIILSSSTELMLRSLPKSKNDGPPFKLREVIGTGGWGQVFVGDYFYANDTVSLVAIKVVSSKVMTQLPFEARCFKQAYPEYLCEVHKTKTHGYLVMPIFSGQPLDRYLARHINLNMEERIHIVSQLLGNLSAIHQGGVTHNDLKTKNILYDEVTKEIHIIDFGCAQLIGTNHRMVFQSINTAVFALEMPPEYITGTIPDPSSDVFAITPIIAEILGIDHKELVIARLKTAAIDFIRTAAYPKINRIITAFTKENDKTVEELFLFDKDIRALHNDPILIPFMQKYANTPYNFKPYEDELGGVFVNLLTSMQLDPDERPTAQEAKEVVDVLQEEVDNGENLSKGL